MTKVWLRKKKFLIFMLTPPPKLGNYQFLIKVMSIFVKSLTLFFYTLIKLGYLKFAIKLSERILKISKVLFFSVFVHKLNTIKSFLCFFLSDSKKRPKS